MKYHKIPNIPLETCTAEQFIAHNIAFRLHISFQDEYDGIKKASPGNATNALNTMVHSGMRDWKLSQENKPSKVKYNDDAIFSALNAGIKNYMDHITPTILTSYSEIGKAFPDYYLSN